MNKQKISLLIDKDNTPVFFPILQQGFSVPARVGCSLKSLLCDQFEITPEYLSDRIRTLFLNGKPVDDVESTIIIDGSILALSAAMPGLVGATFRRGGALSAFRSSITHKSKAGTSKISNKGRVTIKLFNLLVSEMGPGFLENGIWVETGIMNNFIEEIIINRQTIFESIIIDGRKTGLDELRCLTSDDSLKPIHVFIQINR